MKHIRTVAMLLAVGGVLAAQSPRTSETVHLTDSPPVFRVTSVARTAKAISYLHRSGSTKIDFVGTSLMPAASGEAKVQSKRGYIEIEVKFDGLNPAVKNGAEYLTYVLWAITPEGRTSNLGELVLQGSKSKLNVTTELQVFGLVVTAEPYFSVTRPSDLVVMENAVRQDTRGRIEEIDAKYELLERGQYERLANPLELKFDRKTPLELYQARNAVQIARASGADRFAAETFEKAEYSLQRAEDYQSRKAGKKPVTMTARQAVQTAEDARTIAVQRQEEELVAAERQAGAAREAQAETDRARAQAETERVKQDAETAELEARRRADRLRQENEARTDAAQAAADRLRRENEAQAAAARIETERVRREAAVAGLDAQRRAEQLQQETEARMAAARAETDRLQQENEAQANAARAETDRVRREAEAAGIDAQRRAEQLQRETESRMAAARAETDRLQQENVRQRESAQALLDRAAQARELAETEKAELRAQLLQQFQQILETRDSARGLIVNMSDVLFDTGKHSLRPAAREKLAKVAGILSTHAGLQLEVEGHTDNVGGDDYNQQLSERRGEAVHGFLAEQGIASSSMTTRGFGKTRPTASNDSAEGRQQNRRVELVISGGIIDSSASLTDRTGR